MKNKFFYRLMVCIVTAYALVLSASPAGATIKLYDDKLILSGFVKETVYIRTSLSEREKEYRDMALDFAKTSVYLEGLYTIKESSDYTLRFFAGFKWWYESASGFLDDNLSRHIHHRHRKDYVSPRSFDDDILTEAYVDFIKGPLQIRLGKQIVIWGQLDVDRVADVVNPVDLRWNVPGVDTWEEIKKGLWMIRTIYQTELPGNLIFEGIFNPGYFQEFRLPYDGTHWGAPYEEPFGAPGIGIFGWQQEKFHRDAPTWNLSKNYEWGLRVRGYTLGVDWTLLYWNALSDSPVANPNRLGDFSMQYISAAIRAASRGGTIQPGDWPDYKVYYYKRMQTLGGTAQYYASWFRGAILRLEWFYNFGQPFNSGGRGEATDIDDWTRRDTWGVAVSYSDKFRIPYWTEKIGTGKMLDMTITFLYDKIRDNHHDLYKSSLNHRPGDSSAESISLFLMQMMFNGEWTFVFTGSYKPRITKFFGAATVTYSFPGSHWYADMGYKFYGARHGYTYGTYHDKDAVILRLRYEF